MKLNLNWKKGEEIFNLGILERKDDIYFFTINYDELKKAIKKGCVGIGNFDLLQKQYQSKKLFSFFKNRIPSKDDIKINEILEMCGIDYYDEMILLKNVRKSNVDNYYIEEV